MTKKKAIELKGKFVIAVDTLIDGWCCMMDGEEGNDDYQPTLFDSEEEAFAEMFDANHSMLQSHLESDQLGDMNEGVTSEMVNEMGEVLKSGDVKAMRAFMDRNPQCDDSGEWVEPAETFLMNRKAFLTESGIQIAGTKIFL